MILNRLQILEEHQKGRIIYASPIDNQLTANCQNQSVDVNLGDKIFVPDFEHAEEVRCANWQLSWTKEQMNDTDLKRWFVIGRGLTIPKGVFFLAYTEQYIGTIAGSDILPEFHQRSTIARLGLLHPKAGWGDVGYYNRWCLEFLAGTKAVIVANMRIGQITFTRTEAGSGDYTQQTGNYQKLLPIKQLIEDWKPVDILPKEFNY
jgi:deoxycytidine triphosphate deaminase